MARDTIIVNASAPLHRLPGRLTEELAIGDLNGAPEYSFGDVYSVAVSGDGSIYVADQATPAVRQYDATGKFIRSFGRVGNGPGEFGSGRGAMNGQIKGPQGVAVFRDGRVIVHSHIGRRVNVYGARGNAIATRNVANLFIGIFLPNDPPILLAGESTAFVRVHENIGRRLQPLNRLRPQAYARYTRDGTRLDTLGEPFSSIIPPHVSRPNPENLGGRQIPFTPDFTWTLSPRGYFITGHQGGRDGMYSIELRVPPKAPSRGTERTNWREGDTVISIRVPYRPVPVQAAEANDFRNNLTEAIRSDRPGWSWNGIDIPKTKPAYKRIWADEQGRIWVRLSAEARPDPSVPRSHKVEYGFGWPRYYWKEQTIFDVLRPNGEYLGQVVSSEQIHPQAARDNTLWAIVESNDGNLAVKRYRIEWPSR